MLSSPILRLYMYIVIVTLGAPAPGAPPPFLRHCLVQKSHAILLSLGFFACCDINPRLSPQFVSVMYHCANVSACLLCPVWFSFLLLLSCRQYMHCIFFISLLILWFLHFLMLASTIKVKGHSSVPVQYPVQSSDTVVFLTFAYCKSTATTM